METIYRGDLTIATASQAKQYEHVEEVTGYLYISADAQFPALTSVGGSLDISADAQLPVLTTVGGSLYISADAQLPVLTTVGSYLDISADAQLPVLTTVGGSLYIRADAQLPVLTTVGGVEISMRPLTILGLQWPVTILDKTMRIGCQEHPLDDWATFDNAQIAAMDGSNAVKFWALNKEPILSAAREAGRVFGVEVAA